jgi:leucyl aminopeptidase
LEALLVRFFVDSSHAHTIPLHVYQSCTAQEICIDLPEEFHGPMLFALKDPSFSKVIPICDRAGELLAAVLIIPHIDQPKDVFLSFAKAAQSLPTGTYKLTETPDHFTNWEEAYLGWALGQYTFDPFKSQPTKHDPKILVIEPLVNVSRVEAILDGIYMARDLINTPASHMGPEELCQAIKEALTPHGASFTTIVGEDLLAHNFPAIHTVGRASHRAPRLLDISWGQAHHPLVTLVGKGVCFDSGGLDIKPASGMLLMKKDMGGAAIVAGLALAIMKLALPIRLRVLIPAVENSIDGNAYRPMDVITMRSGQTVEVGDTDAEGRLILADCLFEGAQEKPALLIDVATLTGAARIAMGTDLPVVFSNPVDLSFTLHESSYHGLDPLWPMPLFKPYESNLKSQIADFSSTGSSPYGGAITAALFLGKFVSLDVSWVHVDTAAWNVKPTPGKTEGGEASSLMSLLDLITAKFAAHT